MNPERQAELIKYLGLSLDTFGQLDPEKPQSAIRKGADDPGFKLTPALLECARHALAVVRAGT